jgi:phosphatidylglycerophosphatase A
VNFLVVLIAQGLGLGRVPFAPGTVGSLAGVGLTALLLATGHAGWYAAGTVAGVALSVWACGEAERVLRQKDPGSVVLDEIVALPVCFAGWVVWHAAQQGGLLRPLELFRGGGALVTLAVFVAFRFFDILKPWPVRQSQALVGGWGVTADDILAAFYVNLILTPVWWLAGV